jgi:AcrR family transcriptional regulator
MNRRRTSRKTANRKDQIIEVGTRLFADRGYHAVTLDEVAEKLEVSKGTLYHHISSKEEILREICNRGMKKTTKEMLDIQKSDISPKEKVRKIVHMLVNNAALEWDKISVIWEQTSALPKRTQDAIRRQKKAVEVSLREILQEGVDKGEFKINDIKIAAFAIFGMCNWTYHWYQPERKSTPEQITGKFLEMLEKGYLR